MNGITFYRVISAFQHFAGKSLKVTDAHEVLTDAELDTMVRALGKIASWCAAQDPDEFPDLIKLGAQINHAFNRKY